MPVEDLSLQHRRKLTWSFASGVPSVIKVWRLLFSYNTTFHSLANAAFPKDPLTTRFAYLDGISRVRQTDNALTADRAAPRLSQRRARWGCPSAHGNQMTLQEPATADRPRIILLILRGLPNSDVRLVSARGYLTEPSSTARLEVRGFPSKS